MTNYLDIEKRQHVMVLLDLGWTCRRIERETEGRRETISRYDRVRSSKAAKMFPGSSPPARSAAAPYRDLILEKLTMGIVALGNPSR